MKNIEIVTVIWFDELKGIGEGKSLKGNVVFLNSNAISSSCRFITLKVGDQIECEIQKKDNSFYASKISRVHEDKITIERSTFLEFRG